MSRHRMVEPGFKVLVGVSGGPDSMALLHVLHLLKDELGISLHVAHLNHMFRGSESEADALFVADAAKRYNLPATVETVDVPAYRARHRLSGQVAARQVRYRFFLETAKSVGASRVALAHQADDQAETILINFLRGSGITGLKGIAPVRGGFYIRPMLTVRRYEIESYCNAANLPFRRDSSNLKAVYARNKIRMSLLPLLEREYNPSLVSVLLRLGEICREEDKYLEEQSEAAYRNSLREASTGRVVLSLEELKPMPTAIKRRVLRRAWQVSTGEPADLSFGHVEAVLGLIGESAAGSKIILPGNVTAVKSYNTIELLREQDGEGVPDYVYPLEIPGVTRIPELGCCISAMLSSRERDVDLASLPPTEAMLDFDKLPAWIFVRKRRDGDVFHPYGLASEMKLKDFFIKQKVPRRLRDRIPLVCTTEEIVWVGGVRTGDRWKVNGNTKRVLHLKLVGV